MPYDEEIHIWVGTMMQLGIIWVNEKCIKRRTREEFSNIIFHVPKDLYLKKYVSFHYFQNQLIKTTRV